MVILVVRAAGISMAMALGTEWQPFERPVIGQEGSGAHTEIKGKKVYTTFPSRPYVVIGLIAATNKLFGNPKTRAVELAKKVGADALLLIDYNRIPVGTTGNWYGTHNYFSGYGSSWGSMNSRIHYRVIAQYAAIRWSRPDAKGHPARTTGRKGNEKQATQSVLDQQRSR